jgi:hypothetical protein
MAANPRIVASDIYVTWDGGTNFVPKGSIVDIPAGSTLEAAYGGSGNLISIGASRQQGGQDADTDTTVASDDEADAGGGGDAG